jgi:ubiquinol-cytochrome c reductase cytochrome b subunit
MIIHLLFLHFTGSTRPIIGSFRNNLKIKFDNYYIYKDLLNVVLLLFILILSLASPFLVGDSENFILANPINSPIHIQPE